MTTPGVQASQPPWQEAPEPIAKAEVREAQAATLRALDLTGRERQLRGAMRVMARVATSFARTARRSLPFLVALKSRLLPQSVAIAEVPGAAQASTGPTLHALYEEEGGTAWAYISLNEVSLGLILEGALGATQVTQQVAFGKELTLAQRALASRLLRALGTELAGVLREEAQLELKLTGVYASPTEPTEHLQRSGGLSVDCLIEGVPGAVIRITAKASSLETAPRENDHDEPPHGDPRMPQIVQDVTVPVVAELGRLTMGLRKVLELEVGQVLRLSTAVHDPVRVEVAGLKKFVGLPVASRGQLAIEIKGRCGG